MENNAMLLTVAAIGFFGQIVATIGAAYLNQRGMRNAQVAARTAAEDASKAQIATSRASKDAADAARALVEAAKSSDRQIARLQDTAEKTKVAVMAVKETGETSHAIINNQRTVMLKLIAELKRRIANENPHDHRAQIAAEQAEKDADDAAKESAGTVT